MTELSLYECKALFDLGLWAEKTFGSLLFVLYSDVLKNTPFVSERVLNLPIGGVDDMAVWASYVWERIARWMDNGPPANPPPRRFLSKISLDGDDEDDKMNYDIM